MRRLNPFWFHGLLAILLGVLMLWSKIFFPALPDKLTDITGSILYWPERPALNLRLLTEAASNWVLERKTLNEQVQVLQKENLAFRATWQKMAKPLPKSTSELISARVTLRHPEAWWKEFRIDRGTRHGVKAGLPVLSDGYLIGKISRVGESYAWVELLTSSSFLLAAVVDETWDLGVVTGDDRGNVWLLYIPEEKEIKKDMKVSTAMVADYMPPGIPIGRIWGAGESREGFLPQKIASGAHLTQLYAVQVYVVGGNQ